MDRAEYFVVRIYRRAPGATPEIEGVVEVVGSPGRQAFDNAAALWAILLQPDRTQARGRAPRRRNST